MDTNIDTMTNSNHKRTYRVTPLQNALQQHINTYNFTVHNDKPTHLPQQRTPNCIDHIFSNILNKLINTTTKTNPYSDHSYITTTYTTKESLYTPKFITLRNNKFLQETI